MIEQPLGHYEIIEPLGAGGMGEVYLARDANLKRDVAIKVLPEELAEDPERLARLEREAHLLAALNHSNIAAIHSLEEAQGRRFLVMELVRGNSLEELLADGPLPVDEALDICRQIAEALEAAHEQGIIHRDLKPANVMVTPHGKAKVLDFGLAKAVEPEGADTDLSHSPTITIAATDAGVIMGTAPYMSPEQVRGKRLDRRADIWAFGCVLYECLTGSKAFDRETVADTLAAILEVEPIWNALPATTPVSVRSLLQRILRKDRRRRLHDIADARIEIEEALGVVPAPADEAAIPVTAPRALSPKLAVPLGVVTIVAVAVAAWLALQPATQPTRSWDVVLPSGVAYSEPGTSDLAISPDGSRVVYSFSRRDQLWLRDAGQDTADPEWRGIPHTERARFPSFSPDGQQLVFLQENTLKRVGFSGAPPVDIAEVVAVSPMWATDGMIYYFDYRDRNLWRVRPESGAEPEQVFPGRDSEWYWGPQILPGGEWVLFSVSHLHALYWEKPEVVVQSLRTGERKPLLQGTHARYLSTGHLTYVDRATLFAVPFDVSSVEPVGEAVAVVEGVHQSNDTGGAMFAVSDSGSLVYQPGYYFDFKRPLVWIDRNGNIEELPFAPHAYWTPRASPDESLIAVSEWGEDDDEILDRFLRVYEVDSGRSWRLTNEGRTGNPTWSPDGQYLYFNWNRSGKNAIWRARVDQSTDPELVFQGEKSVAPYSISADGKTLLFWVGNNASPEKASWKLTLDADPPVAEQLTDLDLKATTPDISPDGRYFTFQAPAENEQVVRIYAQEIATGRRVTVSTGFETRPRWSPAGDEIFYRSIENRNPVTFYAVKVRTEPNLSVGLPQKLFDYWNEGDVSFDASADGQRFLMIAPIEPFSTHLRVVVNWFDRLRTEVPTGR